MFAPISDRVSQPECSRPAAAVSVRSQRPYAVPQTIDEAYELRLLAEVARWDDQAAFEELYHRHHAVVTRVAQQVCRDAEVAREITQHTFTALWVRAERLVNKSVRLRPWLTTVARNAAIDHVRADRPTVALCDATDSDASIASPEDLALSGVCNAELANAMTTLSPEQQAAIEKIYFCGLTYAAAADALGEPIGTIKSRIRLALGHLRERLADSACCA